MTDRRLTTLVLAGFLVGLPSVAAEPREAEQKQAESEKRPAEAGKETPNQQDQKLDATTAALLRRSNEAFTAGDYALALPMLKKLREYYKDQPDRLGPINERIRVCQKNLGQPVDGAADSQAASTGRPANGAPTGEQRKAHTPPKPGELRAMTIQALGNFEYDQEKGGNIPPDVQALTGAKVRLNGYMIPMDQADKITKFALVPDLFACCFGQPPQIQHSVTAVCPPGKAVNYYPEEIIIEGTLKVEEKKEDGFILSVFEVDVSSVKPAPK